MFESGSSDSPESISMNTLCDNLTKDQPGIGAGPVEVRRLDPLAGSEWDDLVASHPEAGLFHRAAWARVLVRTYGHHPLYLACYQAGSLTALIPLMEVRSVLTGRRGVCVPFADYCGPLYFAGGSPRVALDALSALAKERGWRYFELRDGPRPEPGASAAASFLAHSLDLRGGPDKLFAGFSSAVRRALRKAERGDLKVEMRLDREAVVTFYRLHTRTRRRHGLPPQSLAFFLNIYEEIIQPGHGSVVLASDGSTPVAAAVYFHSGKHALYKFGASDERLQATRANNLVMWTAIRLLAERGYHSLHFGRTSIHNEGLRRYKMGWGSVETPLDYYRLDPHAGSWVVGKDVSTGAHNAVFSRLPITVNRLLGWALYAHRD